MSGATRAAFGVVVESWAIGAWADGVNVGFGFSDDAGYVTVPAMNLEQGVELSFQVYDASAGTTTDVVLGSAITFSNHGVTVVGCTDPLALNYLADATVDSAGCTY